MEGNGGVDEESVGSGSISGDFHAWMGELGGDEEERYIRDSRNMEVNKEGSKVLSLIEDIGWTICNRSIERAKAGEHRERRIIYKLCIEG